MTTVKVLTGRVRVGCWLGELEVRIWDWRWGR